VLFRFDAPLIFANTGTFRDAIRGIAAQAEAPSWIIVAAEPMTDVDTTGCDMLDDLAIALDLAGHRLVFAEMKDPVRAKLKQYGMDQALPDDRFYPTITSAVRACQEATRSSWTPPQR
jgi:MFS superfamily sulfate permease-like transporter